MEGPSTMSVQWVAVAFFLYVELAITLLLVLPLLSPQTWKRIFGFRIFSTIQPAWNIIFYAILLILVVLFADSIRTMNKYGDELAAASTLDAKIDRQLKQCRGQRNFYITGFALFLVLVIRRLVTMLSRWATLQASHTATLRQAESANAELQRRMREDESRGVEDVGKAKKMADTKEEEEEEEGEGEGEKVTKKGPTQEEFDALQKELNTTNMNLQAMKKQAESTNREYDRLAEENQKLQDRLQQLESGQEESKKDL